MTKLIIARHGNTFGPGDTPTRVGGRTDIPLVASGIEQAKRLGVHLKSAGIIPDAIYSAELLRTKQTAQHAFPEQSILTLPCFNEIDYGPDENKTEDEVIARVGEKAISDWNDHAIVPEGWQVSPSDIIQSWHDFADGIIGKHKTVLVVTSNGIARFAPYLTGDFAGFCKDHTIKLKTGALSIFNHTNHHWDTELWNFRP